MATPHEKLADALDSLRHLQEEGRRVFQSAELSPTNRRRLVDSGFLQEVIRGWLISASPTARDGDSTPWYASFWEFCGKYCNERFQDKWHLSADQSLLLHAENSVVPKQVVVYAKNGANNTAKLPFGTSLYDLKETAFPPATALVVRDNLRLFSPSAALTRVSEAFFSRYPVEAQIILTGVKDPADVLQYLLEQGRSVVAGRLIGAFRHINRPDVADEIAAAMKAAGYSIRENNPFTEPPALSSRPTGTPPIVLRIQALWKASRESVIKAFPTAPGLPKDPRQYLQVVDDIYKTDAYHSLSIEGYSVTPELIERVRSGNWDPENHDEDRRNRDALAARGYWQAFQAVKGSVSQILEGKDSGSLIRSAHRDWYRELFQPCVAAGLIKPSALAGYRNDAVYLRTSRYVPPRWESVRDAMPALFDLLEEEPEASVRAVLGHWLFGYIHPYPDGNGRMARFVMNAMLASGGYPWTVIRVEDVSEYLEVLDRASIDGNLQPFATFVAKRVQSPL
jgi:fido (protein-threonine AMPylation protein)